MSEKGYSILTCPYCGSDVVVKNEDLEIKRLSGNLLFVKCKRCKKIFKYDVRKDTYIIDSSFRSLKEWYEEE